MSALTGARLPATRLVERLLDALDDPARRERWPKSANPHLLVSRHTAMDMRQQRIGFAGLCAMVKPFGVTPSALRADRSSTRPGRPPIRST